MKNKKNKYLFLTCIFLLALIFAYLITNLVINGNVTVGANSWNVYFDNIQVDENSVSTDDGATITDNTTVDFSVKLDKPKDYYKFTVDIVNESTLDAMISEITTPEIDSDLIEFTALYEGGVEISANDLLPAGSTYTIEVSVEYTDSENLPEEDDDLTIEYGIDYIQADDSAVNPFPKAMVLDDTNGNGVADVGEIISIDTEDFYVISNDGTNIKALAKWNLLVGNSVDSIIHATPLSNPTGLQDVSAKAAIFDENGDRVFPWVGTQAFANDCYWASSYNREFLPIDLTDSNNIIFPYLQDYKTALEEMGAKIEDVTLITYEELVSLGCVDDYYDCLNAPNWVYQTSYWTRTDNTTSGVWLVNSMGDFTDTNNYTFGDDDYLGIRPVIEILASNL